jgi:hypothetical protein
MLRRLFFVFLVAAVPLARAGAATVLPLSLDQLARQADRIFVGRCESVTAALDERGLPSTYARFVVEDGLKGVAAGGTVVIKQFGADRTPLRVEEGKSAVVTPKTMSLPGSTYRTGASYLLFLYPESDWGFTSPVGGGQGRFEIFARKGQDASLQVMAVNPLENRFLETLRAGPVPLSDILREIRAP